MPSSTVPFPAKDIAALRPRLRDLLSRPCHPQILLRCSYPPGPGADGLAAAPSGGGSRLHTPACGSAGALNGRATLAPALNAGDRPPD